MIYLFCRNKRRAMGTSGIGNSPYRLAISRISKALYSLVLCLILFPLQLHAQSNTKLKGNVFDTETGAAVAGATVVINGTAYISAADDRGFFEFEHIPPGSYSISVSSVGYKTFIYKKIEVLPDITVRVAVRLHPRAHYLGKFNVTDKRMPLRSNKIVVIRKSEIEQSGAQNIPELLSSVEGLYVQKTGQVGSRTEIKIRGGASRHVLILIDGQKINPSGSGVADLSTIPIEMVERVEVYKGGASAEFGPDALAGAINIITIQNNLNTDFSADIGRAWGAWKNEQYRLTIVNPIAGKSFSCKLGYSLNQSVGDFPFSYAAAPVNKTFTGNRINNALDAYNYFSSGIFQIRPRLRMNWSAQWYRNYRGMPDRASRQNATAYSTDRRKLVSLGMIYDGSDKYSVNLDIGLSRFEQHFIEPDTTISMFYRFDSRFVNDIITLNHRHRFNFGNNFEGRFGLELRRDILDHTDKLAPRFSMHETTRDNAAAFFSADQRFDVSWLHFADNLSITGAIRYDWSETRKDSTSYRDTITTNHIYSWSPKIGAAISKGDDFSYVLRANYGRSLRLPSINALFWKGDVRAEGNPGLKPERSEHSEAGLELTGRFAFAEVSGGITYFHSSISDLIVWLPLYGGWKPVNRDRALITGHEDYVHLDLFHDRLSFQYQNTILTPLNKSPGHVIYNKQLVFSPHYVTVYTAKIDTRYLYGSYSIRRCDKAYTLESNNKYYAAYRVDDLHIGARYVFNCKWNVSADLKFFNIRDENYVLITHYPMPGREWYFGLTIKYGIKNGHK